MLGHGGRKPWIISSESLVQLISGMRAAVLVLWGEKKNKMETEDIFRVTDPEIERNTENQEVQISASVALPSISSRGI